MKQAGAASHFGRRYFLMKARKPTGGWSAYWHSLPMRSSAALTPARA